MIPLCAIFRRHLKKQNLKYTQERADILDAIIEHDALFEADELLRILQDRGHRVSKATVYRTIRLLQDAGIISQTLFDAKQAHYQLIYGKAERDHLVCMDTGRCEEFNDPDLVALAKRICTSRGWEYRGHRFQVYGTCPDAEPSDESS